MSWQQVFEDARSLSAVDRIELVMELWETVADSDLALTAQQRTFLEERLAADEAVQAPAKDWETLKAELLRGEV